MLVLWFALACGHEAPVEPLAPESVTLAPATPDGPAALEPPIVPIESTLLQRYDVIAAGLERLHVAGDAERCRAEMAQLRRELARDVLFSEADLISERAFRDTRGSGPMPYPSRGTACAIFGIQTVLEGAINDRARARGEPPRYAEDGRPLVVGGE